MAGDIHTIAGIRLPERLETGGCRAPDRLARPRRRAAVLMLRCRWFLAGADAETGPDRDGGDLFAEHFPGGGDFHRRFNLHSAAVNAARGHRRLPATDAGF